MSEFSGTYGEKLQRLEDVETARARGWAYFLGAYLTGPIFPGIVAARTKKWVPFWAGLGLGVVSLPFAALDLGILTSIPAAGLGTALMAQESQKARRRLDIVSPEEADLLRFRDI